MDGILLFDKPILWTSHDAVDFLRRRLGQRAIGHAGTLDPMATGLLVMLLGKATKKSAQISAAEKDYRGLLTLGIQTDTQDMEGRILSIGETENVSEEDVARVFSELTGTQLQTPPQFSAVRKDGKRLYDLARRGVAVQVKAREVTVSEFRIEGFYPPEIRFFLRCSKGTYARSLCDEAGRRLGCGGVLSALARTRVGPFLLERALGEIGVAMTPLREIEKMAHENLSRL